MKMKNIPFGQLAMEFVSVVFAVILALGLNSYKQALDAESEAIVLKNSIIKECQENLIKVDSMLIKNQDYANYLDSLVSLDPDDVQGVKFIYEIELLTDAAWVIAQNNAAINKLDQDFLISSAEIYQTQVFFTEFSRSFFQNLGIMATQQDETPPYSTALSLYFNISVINNGANDLKQSYQELITKYAAEE